MQTRNANWFARHLAGLLVTDTQAGAVSEHASSDVHSKQFLEKELGRVGDMNLRDARLVVAGTTFVFALLELTARLLVT